MIGMGRREFITLLGGALTSRPIPANAQPAARTRTVGVLMGLADDAEARGRARAFEQGLEGQGWSLGQNLRIEYRYAEGDSARMQALAKELVELKPDCIVGHSTPVVTALKHATRTIPIVFVSVSDPDGQRIRRQHGASGRQHHRVHHPARTASQGNIYAMLKEIVPQLARVALMYNPESVPDSGAFFSGAFLEPRRNTRYGRSSRKCTTPPRLKIRSRNSVVKREAASLSCRITSRPLHREAHHFAHRAVSHSGNLPLSLFCRGRRAPVLRGGCRGPIPARSGVREPHPSRCRPGGSSSASADEVRAW